MLIRPERPQQHHLGAARALPVTARGFQLCLAPPPSQQAGTSPGLSWFLSQPPILPKLHQKLPSHCWGFTLLFSCLLGGPVYLVRGCPGTLRLQLGHLSLAAVPILDKLCIPSTEASNQAKILAWNSLTQELHDSSLQLRNSLFGQIGKAEMLGMWYLLD